MKSQLIDAEQDKTFAVIFDKGDEVMAGLLEFAKQNKLAGSLILQPSGSRPEGAGIDHRGWT